MKKVVLFILILAMFPLLSNGQSRIDSIIAHYQKERQAHIDSLLSELSNAKEDTNKVKIYIDLTSAFKNNREKDKALNYGNQGLTLAQKINYKKGEAESYRTIGGLQKDESIKLEYYFKFLRISEDIKDKVSIADSYESIGQVFSKLNNHALALDYYLKSLKLKSEIGDKKAIASTYWSIASVYDSQGNYLDALEYYFKSIDMSKEIGDTLNLGWRYNNIGCIYRDHGKYSSALEYYFKFLKIAENEKDSFAIPVIYQNIAHMYKLQGNYSLALENIDKSVKIQKLVAFEGGIGASYFEEGRIYYQQKKYQEAEYYYLKGVDLFKGERIEWTYEEFAELYDALALSASISLKQRGAYAIKALKYFKLNNAYKASRDSFNNDSIKVSAIKLQMSYSFERKEEATKAEQEKKDALAVSESKKQKLIILFVVLGLLLVLVFTGLIFRSLRIRNKQNKIIVEQKKRSDELLLNILPSAVAEELKETGSSKAKGFDNVSVLFTDFVGFTIISEKLSPAELVEEVNLCFSAFDSIIERNGLEKIKTIGDAYLAVCGLPNGDENHAKNTVQAAKEIMAFINKRELEGGKFKIRIGINSGSVVAGIVGVKKFAYDIWGDTVNTAARMEQNSTDGKINISGTTYELVKNDYTCTYRGKIDAKNKGEIDMYFVD